MAVFKLIPLLCTHIYSYMFSTVHPPRILVNTYHHELLVQYAWRPMHPPLKSFFEVATY